MHSIRFKITAVTIAAILTSLLAFIGIGYYTIAEENDKTSVEKLNLLSQNAQKTVDVRLNSLKRSVDVVADIAEDSLSTFNLADYGTPGTRTGEQAKQLDAYMEKYCKNVRDVFGSIANHSDSIATYYFCISPDIGTSEHGFFYSKVGKTAFEEQPKLIADKLNPDDVNSNWYFSPIRLGKPCWVGPYFAHFLGELLTISYVAPISKDNVLIGVLGMDTLFYSVRSPVHALKVYDTGFASLMDDTGRILYHPRLKPGTRVEEVSPNLNPELFRRESNGSELIRYNAEGQRRQVSFTTLANGLKLVVAAPVAEIFSSWQKMTRSILVSALAILTIFAVVTLFIVGAVTKPLLRLTSASRKLADGDYNAELDYEGDDEVGILTQSFRQMRDHLKLYISDLNSRAYSDALTGIKNKGAFDIAAARLNDTIHHSGDKSRLDFAVVMFDCNNLKKINDEFGHEQGDIYLQTATRVICQTFVHSPVFRLGGDEFAAVLQREDYRDREKLMSVFDKKVEEINAVAKNPWEKVNIAKGMAAFRPGLDTDIDQVMRRADEQMYENKRQSKLTAAVSIPNFDAIES